MTTHSRSIPMVFNYIKLGTDIRGKAQELGLSLSDVDTLANCSSGTTSRLATHNEPNPKMVTWLSVVNALDLDPRDYFVLKG